MNNAFLNAVTSHDARTYNDAVSHSTSGSTILDYFAKCGSYRFRDNALVCADMASIFAEDENLALKVMFYNRLVTRKVKGLNDETKTVQRGQGQRDEFVKSLQWLEINRPELFKKNLWMVPVVGRWSDLWYDSPVTKLFYYANRKQVFKLIKHGLKSKYHRALLAKYLPKIRSKKNVNNDRHRRLNEFARNLCTHLGWTEKQYRQFKSAPENMAHLWQRYMCENAWNDIDFNMIPGKALFNLVSRHGKDGLNPIDRHHLTDAYEEWIESKPVAKFTGYVYELYRAAKCKRGKAQTFTFNKQFEGLLELAKQNVNPELLKRGVLCALDTSGSMSSFTYYTGNAQFNFAPIDVCVGLGIYFSSLLSGNFKDYVVMFDSRSRFVKLQGSFCDKVDQINKEPIAWGNTNFQSVIDSIVNVRRSSPNIPVSDYPQVLLVVSDMELDSAGKLETNYELAMNKLGSVGLPRMTIIWWNVNGNYTQHIPNKMTDEGVVMISGFDPAIVTTILGGQEEVIDEKTGEKRKLNPYESMLKALDQEILNRLSV